MKANAIIVSLIILLLIAGVIFFMAEKRKKGKIIDFIPGTNNPRVVPHSGQTFQGITDLEFFQNLGMSKDFLQSNHSPSDLSIARKYTENFARKGIKITSADPLYNEVKRIASYSPIVNTAFIA